ncbi:AraC family transcriptional regulator [Clostridium estertheticum]|uniref:AraC family transcriptional regulator n=1 Tax=Clostridium estertheticum TaxID=238834 RepID=UPI0013E93E3E|nr:helix-turn-helix domain-containing protein [Clostridium estertheticum]MBZ9686747.1 AraC family transcriptional regulator [Clostridium estertheticum]
MKNLILFPILHKNITDLPFFITGMGIEYIEKGVVRNNGYHDYQWSYCVEGRGKFIIDEKSYEIGPNTAFFFRRDIPHQYFPIQEPWITKWMTFNGVAVNGLLNYMNINNWEIINLSQKKDIDYIIEDIYKILSLSDKEKHVSASSLLYKFLIKMSELKENSFKEGNLNLYKKLQPVITLMENNYSGIITLEEMAEKVNVNKYYLCRIFKEAYLITPFEYLNQLRIQKSKEVIINNKYLKINQIAFNVGFNDTSYFCSMFRKIEGCTPIEFKKRH